MIGLLHAYSRANAGDDLLVDLTLRRLAAAMELEVHDDAIGRDLVLVALDRDSFRYDEDQFPWRLPHRRAIGTHGRLGWAVLPAMARGAGLALPSLARLPVGGVARSLRRCRALIAVGGGYLRAGDTMSSAGTAVNHLPQLVAAARYRGPTLYLPQSVGPLRGPVGAAVRRTLRGVDVVCVRDPDSERELAGMPNVRRVPDLAVLDMADRAQEISYVPAGRPTGFVIRCVGHAPGYEDHVIPVARALGGGALWAVQAEGHPSKSDAVFYEELGLRPEGRLVDLLAEDRLSVVVSVRLHGALMALRAGVPAIHLAYEPKGPAAFADLGLGDWCFDVGSLDRDELAAAVKELAADPAPYWRRFEARVAELRSASHELDVLVEDIVHG